MKRLCILLALCLLLLLLAACGSAPEEIVLSPLDPAETPTLSRSESSVEIRTPYGRAVPAALPTPAARAMPEAADGTDPAAQHYVLNTNSKRFHLPGCSSVGEMKESNRDDFYGSREELLDMGYTPCGRCHP